MRATIPIRSANIWLNESIDQDCDSPNVYGTHNLNLGADGPEDSQWDFFYPNITTYQVPQ